MRCSFCSEIALLYIFKRNWSSFSLGQRTAKKLSCVSLELHNSEDLGSFFFPECFIKIDERKCSVLRQDALCSERDLSQRSCAGAPHMCPTGLLCAACYSFFLLSSKQLSNC